MIAAAALALAAAAPNAIAAQSIPIQLAPGEVLLRVEAEGSHLSQPDVMSVTAGVVTTGRTAREALAANSALAARLIEVVRESGVDPRDVETSELAVNPQFERANDEDNDNADDEQRVRRIVGYVARNRLHLRLRELGRAPDVIDRLFAAGANEVRGPSFSLNDPAPAVRQARRVAVAAALAEATDYADALNMRIVRVLRVSERGEFEQEEGNYITVTGGGTRATPIEPGDISIDVQVWIDYALVPR